MAKDLTPEQAKKVDEYGTAMLKNGIRCGVKTNRKTAKTAIDMLYKKYLDLPAPKEIIFVDSPEEAIRLVAKSTKADPKSLVNELLFFNLWTWWVAYYWAGVNLLDETVGVEEDLIADLNEYEKVTRELHACLPCEQICFVIENPKVIHIKDNDLEKFQLHREGGMALEYGDGSGFAWLNGVEVPTWVASTPAAKLSVKKVMAEKNVDVRREGLRRIPLAKFLKAAKAKLLDKSRDPVRGKHWDYALYDADFGDGKTRRLLRMKDVASGGFPVERAEDDCKTVLQTLAWRDGEDEYIEPSVRT